MLENPISVRYHHLQCLYIHHLELENPKPKKPPVFFSTIWENYQFLTICLIPLLFNKNFELFYFGENSRPQRWRLGVALGIPRQLRGAQLGRDHRLKGCFYREKMGIRWEIFGVNYWEKWGLTMTQMEKKGKNA